MNKLAIYSLAFVFAFTSIGVTTVSAAGSATFGLSLSSTAALTGDSFSLTIWANPNGESLDTGRVEMDFDASMMEMTSFLLGTGFPYQSPSNIMSNTTGTVSLGAFTWEDPVTESGVFATVTFRALRSGETTLTVDDDSKLISDGEEKIDVDGMASIGTVSISISGDSVASESEAEVGADETAEDVTSEDTTSEPSSSDLSAEAEALAYYGTLVGSLPMTDNEWEMLHCIAYDDCYQDDARNLTYEAEARAYFEVFFDLPDSSMDWQAVHALAYTQKGWEVVGIVEETSSTDSEEEEEVVGVTVIDSGWSAEQIALVYFGAFYARMPESSNDWDALHCIAYGGCTGDPRDLNAEAEALVLFGQKYTKMPSSFYEWNVLHTIAYTDLLTYNEEGSSGDLSLEERAIGWFGKITGYLPSSNEDWTAVHYMVDGYTPDSRDLSLESSAITTFVQVFGYIPSTSQHWNIVAAIAYSGAF